MRLSELRAECKRWQHNLGLQHWRVTIRWGKSVEGDPTPFTNEIGEDSAGITWWMPESPNAIIILRRDQGVHTLVHELLHLRLDGHRSVIKYDSQYERALNHIVDALVGTPDLQG